MLSSTECSSAEVDAVVVALLPSAAWLRAVVDASSLLSSSLNSMRGNSIHCTILPLTSSTMGSTASPGELLFSMLLRSSLSSLSGKLSFTSKRGSGGSSARSTRCRKQAAMPFVQRLFSSRMTRLSASTMLMQRLHSPGLQLWQGLPALVQGQLHEVQELATKQKQQRSSWAAIVF